VACARRSIQHVERWCSVVSSSSGRPPHSVQPHEGSVMPSEGTRCDRN
jgi:hypothetical protein